jgi:polyhydroxybutyrate depolymerase
LESKEIEQMRTRLIIAIGILGLALVAVPQASAQGITMRWTVEGEQRVALVFPPAPTRGHVKHPLVFAFHGHSGNMNSIAQLMDIHSIWKNAIVVYPQGVNRPSPVDPQGNRSGWQTESNQPNIGNKDLSFFDAMLATMRQKYPVDDTRVYAVGFSNGAVFSLLLWAQRGQTLAAIGECAGRLAPSEQLTLPRPLIAIAGLTDRINPFRGQKRTIEIARQADNATGAGQPCGQYCTRYPSTTQTPVKTFIHPGGHIYPSWASGEIVKFFIAHPQP